MSRPSAVLLITAGVVAGSHYLFPPAESSREVTEITRISVAPDRDYRSNDAIPSFAPTPAVFREVSAVDADAPVVQTAPMQGTWTTVVTAGRSVVSPVRSARPADPATRGQLTLDLQSELQRVGCYQGEINGSWNAATRRAMSAFMDRANAVLPFSQPDYVLLALVQSHREITCAAECPTGQAMQSDGRCLPRAVLAQEARRQKRLEQRRQIAEANAVEKLQDGRLASAETSQPEVLPWQRTDVDVRPVAEVAIAPRPNPLPGRMSIGGPPLPIETAATPPAVSGSALPAAKDTTITAKLAALQYEPDADDLSDDATVPDDAAPVLGDSEEAKPHKKKKRHSERERSRRYNSYASSGRRRQGDPRPGTARFNLMQSLGGVY